jgi:hypothetical protein
MESIQAMHLPLNKNLIEFLWLKERQWKKKFKIWLIVE